MTKRKQTYLHGFDGFYCSVFDPQLDNFDGEFEALFEGRVTEEQEKPSEKKCSGIALIILITTDMKKMWQKIGLMPLKKRLMS